MDRFAAAARCLVADFEHRFGYPPGTNEVVLADGDHLHVLEKELGSEVPAQVATFFAQVDHVVLEDFWNGYFIGPLTWTADLHRAAEPRFVRCGDMLQEVLIVASNGGGVLYAAPLPSGEPILVLPSGGIESGVYDADQPMAHGFGPVAADLAAFLDHLSRAALDESADDPFAPGTVR